MELLDGTRYELSSQLKIVNMSYDDIDFQGTKVHFHVQSLKLWLATAQRHGY